MIKLPISAGFIALIDDGDLSELSRHKWTRIPRSGGKGSYAARWVTLVTKDGRKIRKTIYMHRQLMRAETGIEVDHEDGNGLNNQRGNLRVATHNQNGVNKDHTNKYRGVYPFRNKWKAQAKAFGQNVHLGTFDDPIKAARAYDQFVLVTWGEFARLNGV